jgi:hypothetical protein
MVMSILTDIRNVVVSVFRVADGDNLGNLRSRFLSVTVFPSAGTGYPWIEIGPHFFPSFIADCVKELFPVIVGSGHVC